jgi:DNA-binding PadR family transcriptional regulator
MVILAVKEEIILSALTMLGGKSSGAPLRKKVIEISQKEIVYGTLYNLMDVLIRKGYVTSRKSDPQPVQGGRSKTIYAITGEGRRALRETLALHEQLRKGLAGLESGGES